MDGPEYYVFLVVDIDPARQAIETVGSTRFFPSP
jgi:hypothetical protein